MFKVGDKVRRKEAYWDVNRWTYYDKVFTVVRVVSSNYRDTPNLYFKEDGDNNWHGDKFELVGPARNLPTWW